MLFLDACYTRVWRGSVHTVEEYRASAVTMRNEAPEPHYVRSADLGELPFQESFKLGFQIGYQLNDYVYVGFVYQIPDRIRRNDSSFNAHRTRLDGLPSSGETVGQRPRS